MKMRCAVGALTCIIYGICSPPVRAQDLPPWHWAPDQNVQESEVVMLFIGSSDDGANAHSGYGTIVSRFKARLAEAAARNGHKFTAIGVSIDWIPAVGADYLLRGVAPGRVDQEFGPWSEIHVGRNWLNAVLVEEIWGTDPDSLNVPWAAVPQIIVYSRTVASGTALVFGEKRLLLRVAGRRGFEQWLQEGDLKLQP